jgi:hypothetical protein
MPVAAEPADERLPKEARVNRPFTEWDNQRLT